MPDVPSATVTSSASSIHNHFTQPGDVASEGRYFTPVVFVAAYPMSVPQSHPSHASGGSGGSGSGGGNAGLSSSLASDHDDGNSADSQQKQTQLQQPQQQQKFGLSSLNSSSSSSSSASSSSNSSVGPRRALQPTGLGNHRTCAEGYLVKLSGGTGLFRLRNFRRRWFQLRGFVLQYYRDRRAEEPMKEGFIDLRGRSVFAGDAGKFAIVVGPKVTTELDAARAKTFASNSKARGGAGGEAGATELVSGATVKGRGNNSGNANNSDGGFSLGSPLASTTAQSLGGLSTPLAGATTLEDEYDREQRAAAESERRRATADAAVLVTVNLTAGQSAWSDARSFHLYAADRASWVAWMGLLQNATKGGL